MGSKSQLSSIFASIFMAILIGYAGPAISYIPVCIVSTNIVLFLSMSLKGFADLPMIWRGSRFDACVWVATFICCITLNVQIGLFFGIAISVLMLILKSQKPRLRVLGKLKNSGGFVPIKYYEQAEEIEGIRIIQIQSPFHYASAPYLIENIKSLALEQQTAKRISPGSSRVATNKEPTLTTNALLRTSKPRPLFRKSSLKVANISASYNDLQHIHSRDLELESTISERSSLDSTPYSSVDDDAQNSPKMATGEFILVGPHHRNVGTFRVILDLGTMGYMDAVGIRALEQVASDLRAKGIEVLLAKIKGKYTHLT
ncbi:hypothetical protein RvY_11221-2 [Ramazzottius varieornatus]|uniref:STAS domain-containing protein n=1 Tax=Ramazzottius varieornatus TaxID=947166 RepID=A0A1D1VP94_RAMVA|nr:hypothetical protein RvY_11221-2 [Ramazzottius varieornatus]